MMLLELLADPLVTSAKLYDMSANLLNLCMVEMDTGAMVCMVSQLHFLGGGGMK
jgi:hypothetical protein